MYKELKAALKKEYSNIKYFNKAFFTLFLDCKKAGDFTPVKSTDFYKNNGTCYCLFLELMEG